ncbi:prostasin-like [Littorina saxatilis]|uniref:Peptidase S1 domain-containing protein n=1 Tax=Littorina saxatilis TaxID=31220 RepID=A0AAN9BLN1_9CAEN
MSNAVGESGLGGSTLGESTWGESALGQSEVDQSANGTSAIGVSDVAFQNQTATAVGENDAAPKHLSSTAPPAADPLQRNHKIAAGAVGSVALVAVLVVCLVLGLSGSESGDDGDSKPQRSSSNDYGVSESTCKGSVSPYRGSKEEGWLVTVQVQMGNAKTLCGGSVIGTKYILTAASCIPQKLVDSNGFVTAASSNQIGSIKVSNKDSDLAVDVAFVHAGFNPDLKYPWHDIALLRLKETIPSPDPVCLPASNLTAPSKCTFLQRGQASPASSSDAMRLNLNVYNHTKCLDFKNFDKNYEPFFDDSVLCTNSEPDQGGICYGDTGSPVLCHAPASGGKAESALSQFGIVSVMPTKSPCGVVPGYVTYLTNVPYYRAWLSDLAMPALEGVTTSGKVLDCYSKGCGTIIKASKPFPDNVKSYVCNIYAAYMLCEKKKGKEGMRRCAPTVIPKYLVRGEGFDPVTLSRTKLNDFFDLWRQDHTKCSDTSVSP